jgi:hypothetical protein
MLEESFGFSSSVMGEPGAAASSETNPDIAAMATPASSSRRTSWGSGNSRTTTKKIRAGANSRDVWNASLNVARPPVTAR